MIVNISLKVDWVLRQKVVLKDIDFLRAKMSIEKGLVRTAIEGERLA